MTASLPALIIVENAMIEMPSKVIRCAAYTRKSTEDGLQQEFNSIEAQFEACAAYALSQRHLGWVVADDRYDDGGFSGGDMRRPALLRLLEDIKGGKIDVILVYKIDRLTRSLADFAKIVDLLDSAGASFISVTQSFNTTSSMGRLTLNMLLSFAQFERELTGERIRDKISASKKRGLWMGGPLPLGYRVNNRRLEVDESEAKVVRHIMQRYLAVGSVPALVQELASQGYRTKVQHRASGPHRGGCPYRRGTLYHLLANRIYRGMIVHRGEAFPGQHEPIVSEKLWNKVQERLASGARTTGARGCASRALFLGILFDAQGRAMTPSTALSNGRRYRYYVTRPDLLGEVAASRVPAFDLEDLVCRGIAKSLLEADFVMSLSAELSRNTEELRDAIARADVISAQLRSGSQAERSNALKAMVSKVTFGPLGVKVQIHKANALLLLGSSCSGSTQTCIISLRSSLKRQGHSLKLMSC